MREWAMNAIKPILFNTDMVRAILEDRKTVTRRVIKPRSLKACGFCVARNKQDGLVSGVYDCYEDGRMFDTPQTPPYSPGDILYVPEPWKCRKPPKPGTLEYEIVLKDGTIVKFRFTDKKRFDKWEKYWDKPDNQWQSPYFMPREAARVFLLVTDVQVERLQNITENEAQKEGLRYCDDICQDENWHPTFYDPDSGGGPSTVKGFSRLWDTTIKPADRALYGWDANPYVWCVSFERMSKEEAYKRA